MKNKQTKQAPDQKFSVDNFTFEFDILNKTNSVASATECTGLIQIPPQDIDEAHSYTDIYVVPEQINYGEQRLRDEKR